MHFSFSTVLWCLWGTTLLMQSCAKVTIPTGQQFYAYDGSTARSQLRIYEAQESFKAKATEKDDVLYLTDIDGTPQVKKGNTVTGLSLNGSTFGTPTKQNQTIAPKGFYFSSLEDADSKIKNPYLLFRKWDFYLQGIAIPLKFRPSVGDITPQVETGVSLAIAPGFKHSWNWFRGEKGALKNNATSLSFAAGGLLGVGAVDIKPSTTQGIVSESSATKNAIIPIGIHGVIGLNNIHLGAAFGVDIITGPNRSAWIYKGEPWVGLIVGLDILK